MRLTSNKMRSVPFQIGPIGVQVTHNGNPHFVHDATDRVIPTIAKNGGNNIYGVQFLNNAHGDVIYLPYRPDEVHSVTLPANPGPHGAKVFTTANLDGCCMYFEVKATGDVVVYHANATLGVSPTMQQSATQPTFQTPGCLAQLANLYANASNHYNGVATTMVVALAKARYLREVNNILAHKAAQGRAGINYALPEHGSLTTVVGFFIAGRWEFWFQTFSQFIYRRPGGHWKSKFGYRDKNPHVTQSDYKVVECTRYFRVP